VELCKDGIQGLIHCCLVVKTSVVKHIITILSWIV